MVRKRGEIVTTFPDCEFVDLENNLFRVFEDGSILRKKGTQYVRAPQNRTSRNGRYLTVSGMVNGKQKSFYVHRLLAEAFIPNPESKPQVNHIDGVGDNNSLDNLEWATASENIQHAHDNDLMFKPESYIICVMCRKAFRTHTDYKECSECRVGKVRALESRRKEIRKIENIRKNMSHINFNQLDRFYDEKHKFMALMRYEGMTLQEISEYFGITRERVRQVVKKIETELNPEPKRESNNYIAKSAVSENEIIRARYFNKITLKDISEELKVSVPTYSKMEEDLSLFRVKDAVKVCEILGLDFEKVFLTKDVI
ncbi:sigma factor-like helix-turn-helix DNA-binding protein [Salinicoccus halodurans]|uniref:Helix-turn-helix n=1 Tax=Salinicoccus halodurans TaxID=407035 RepID=A0AA94KXQ5_9STAP|nr:sigma factor-like helix-turn-helix DNA-binding protein [Salinicoccus halodurans]SFK95455.1 Helix-turn-helix [Salinicoccus halodurans]